MRKLKRGNLTIECALIMPVILVCILAIVWLVIFMYDKNVMYRALVHALEAADYKNSSTNNQLKKEIEERFYEDIKGQLVGVKDPVFEIKVSAGKVSAGVESRLDVAADNAILSTLGEIKISVTKKRMDGAKIISDIRRVKALYDIANNLIESENKDLSETSEGE